MFQGNSPASHGSAGRRSTYGGTRRAVVLGGIGGGGRYEPPRKRSKNEIGGRGFAERMNGMPVPSRPSRSGAHAAGPASAGRSSHASHSGPATATRGGYSRPSFGGGRSRAPFQDRNDRSDRGDRGGSRGGFGGRSFGNRPSGRSKRNTGDVIDVSRFVSRAVVVSEEQPYLPTHQFSDFALDDRLKVNIEKKGYKTPTAIQDQAIPHVLQGKDAIGIANTGEGKTAAFLLPLINKMILHPKEKVLIVVPTRELALQIDEEFGGFSRGLGIYSVLLVGGLGMQPQIDRLRRGVRMVIGTPGRIKDMIERNELKLGDFHNLVLDEADRMLDMGFIADIRYLISRLSPERHTMLFSATFSREIETLAGTLTKNPVRISVKKRETAASVEQDIVRVSDRAAKYDKLVELLHSSGFDKVLVFGRTKYGMEKLSIALNRSGFAAASIHGNKSQPQRQRALKDFKDGKAQILVATDVAARGLDIPNVSHVINYDIPATYDDYVHRIGRTGRAGKKGVALTFVGGN